MQMVFTSVQVFLHYHYCFHDHNRLRPGRNLFCSTSEWVNLYLGRRECGTQVRKVFWLPRCLVGLHSLDDFHCQ